VFNSKINNFCKVSDFTSNKQSYNLKILKALGFAALEGTKGQTGLAYFPDI
jgi:hypothetical protein